MRTQNAIFLPPTSFRESLLLCARSLIKTWCSHLFRFTHEPLVSENIVQKKILRLISATIMHARFAFESESSKLAVPLEMEQKKDSSNPASAASLWTWKTFFTHDLSRRIRYAFGSVIKLICHFFLSDSEGRSGMRTASEREYARRWGKRIHHLDESSESLPHYLSET